MDCIIKLDVFVLVIKYKEHIYCINYARYVKDKNSNIASQKLGVYELDYQLSVCMFLQTECLRCIVFN